jgi:iron(III) transport system ATP-binding protein
MYAVSTMTGVNLQNIVKRFGSAVAVNGVDAWIESGTLFFLLGPSGCGKTTLLRIIAGFEPPNSGTVRFDTRDVTRLSAEKRNTGMVFQGYALWPHMSVHENVAFGLKVRKIKPDMVKTRVGEALEMVRMERYAERKPNQLSGGQQQRVALARALAVRPNVLLLDEPLSNLDAKLRLEMRNEIRRIVDESKITTIYVTHDQKEALSLADAMVVMNEGNVVQRGEPRAMYLRPESRFTAEFLGETNFLEGTLGDPNDSGRDVQTPLGIFRSHTSVDGKADTPVTVSIRPEALRLLRDDEPAPKGHTVFDAVYRSTCFLGETAQHEVEVTGGTILKALELRPRDIPANGTARRIAVAPEDAVLLTR